MKKYSFNNNNGSTKFQGTCTPHNSQCNDKYVHNITKLGIFSDFQL